MPLLRRRTPASALPRGKSQATPLPACVCLGPRLYCASASPCSTAARYQRSSSTLLLGVAFASLVCLAQMRLRIRNHPALPPLYAAPPPAPAISPPQAPASPPHAIFPPAPTLAERYPQSPTITTTNPKTPNSHFFIIFSLSSILCRQPHCQPILLPCATKHQDNQSYIYPEHLRKMSCRHSGAFVHSS